MDDCFHRELVRRVFLPILGGRGGGVLVVPIE